MSTKEQCERMEPGRCVVTAPDDRTTYRVGRRHREIHRRAAATRPTIRRDRGDRPAVALLRSFYDDPMFPATSHIAPGRYEELLVNALRSIGPAVALGQRENLSPSWGARHYVKNQPWREAIKYLLEKAGAVVPIVRKSRGPGGRSSWHSSAFRQLSCCSSSHIRQRRRSATPVADSPPSESDLRLMTPPLDSTGGGD
jgi:hypothetical protein